MELFTVANSGLATMGIQGAFVATVGNTVDAGNRQSFLQQIIDEAADAALFQHLGSAPVNVLANKFLDAMTLFEAVAKALPNGEVQEPRIIEQSDAQQAYTQSLLGGTETWVYLPPNRWPRHWKGHVLFVVCYERFTDIPIRGVTGRKSAMST